MKKLISRLQVTVVLSIVVLLRLVGCDARPPNQDKPAIVDQVLGSNVFEQVDCMDTWPSKGLLVTAEHTKRIVLWDALKGKRLCDFNYGDLANDLRFFGAPHMIRFLPKQNAVAYLSNQGLYCLWNLDSNSVIMHINLDGLGIFDHADVTSDGSRLLLNLPYMGHVVLDIKNNDYSLVKVFKGESNHGDLSRLTPDGRQLLIVSTEGAGKLWDIDTRKLVRKFAFPFQVTQLAFSSDGQSIATGTFYEGAVDVWNFSTGQKIAFLSRGLQVSPRSPSVPVSPGWLDDTGQTVYALAFAPDGKRLAAGRGSTVAVWDIETGRQLARWEELGRISGVGFVDSGKSLVAAGLNCVRLGSIDK